MFDEVVHLIARQDVTDGGVAAGASDEAEAEPCGVQPIDKLGLRVWTSNFMPRAASYARSAPYSSSWQHL